MSYFPLSQVKTGLYTNGKEYALSTTGEEYKGYYFETSNGEYYSGETPQDLQVILLVPINKTNPTADLNTPYSEIQINDTAVASYLNLRSQPEFPILILPYYSPVIPTQQDYQIGEFRRYFCKKTNEILYIEISIRVYNDLVIQNPEYLYQSYLAFSMPWQLTGDKEQVYKTNRNIVELTSQQLRLFKFNLYLKEDYLKYYQFTNASNLYTAGGEYKTADGKNYIGYYHIHDKTGPMVGATHIKESHGLLFPINENISTKHNQSTQMKTQTTSSYTPPLNNYSPPSIGGGGGGY